MGGATSPAWAPMSRGTSAEAFPLMPALSTTSTPRIPLIVALESLRAVKGMCCCAGAPTGLTARTFADGTWALKPT